MRREGVSTSSSHISHLTSHLSHLTSHILLLTFHFSLLTSHFYSGVVKSLLQRTAVMNGSARQLLGS